MTQFVLCIIPPTFVGSTPARDFNLEASLSFCCSSSSSGEGVTNFDI